MSNKEKQFSAVMFDLLRHDEDKLADFILAEQSLGQMIAETVVKFDTGPFKCSAGLEWVEEDCILIDFTTLELEEDSTNGSTFDTMRWSNPELYGSMSDSELFGEYVGMTAYETGNLMEKIQDTGLVDAVIDFNKRLDEFALELYAKSEDFRMAYDSWMADRLESYSASRILRRIRLGFTHELAFFMYLCDFIHPEAIAWARYHRAKTDAAAIADSYATADCPIL